MKGLKGKRIVVAGCATGIGEATVERLAAEGAELFLGDVNDTGMAIVIERVSGGGAKVDGRRFDLLDPASIETLLEAATAFLGGLDGIANVAAAITPDIIGKDGPLLEMDVEIWDKTLRGNTTGLALLCKHALPHLIAGGGGAIVNVTSGASWVGEDTRPAYAASKAGLNAVTRHIARAYGKQNIRANCISPGFVTDPKKPKNVPDEWIAAVLDMQSLPRLGIPDDEASGIAFLLSDDAEWVTGQVWNINGGTGFRD